MSEERFHPEIDRGPIEARARAAIESIPGWLWDGRSLPVPIDDIADSHFNLFVREVDDMTAAPNCPPLAAGQTLSGLLLSDRGEIWVNRAEARQWPQRRRFTISHELGHWVLHRGQEQQMFCRHGSVEVPESERRAYLDPIEQEANVFAAELMMPANLIREHYQSGNHDFEGLCRLFAASGAAMGRRLHRVI